MKLPNAQLATVPERKVTHYLFNPAHPAGGARRRFFCVLVSPWPIQRLAEALIRHASENEVVEMKKTSHGRRYVVDGPLTAPDRTSLNVRTAWFINPSSAAPRFVTAHPLPKL